MPFSVYNTYIDHYMCSKIYSISGSECSGSNFISVTVALWWC